MIGTIIFFVIIFGLVVSSVVFFRPSAQDKKRELEEIQRQQKTFWAG